MSKNSNKQLYTQTMEWVGTLKQQRKRRVKQGNSRMGYNSKQSNRLLDGFIKQKRNG